MERKGAAVLANQGLLFFESNRWAIDYPLTDPGAGTGAAYRSIIPGRSGIISASCLKMTFQQFKNLSEADQEFIIWSKGTDLAKREDPRFRYFLCQVDGFYIEIRCNKRQNSIDGFFFFDSPCHLDPYLPGINIDAVYAWLI
jgi:hypothetical protein